MKIIFLDVDGVLNHSKTLGWGIEPTGDVLDQECVQRIIEICDLMDTQIVLSSTWRLSDSGCRLLRFTFRHRLIAATPVIWNVPRREEILAWLKDHPLVTRFVVIDDDVDAEIPGKPFVRTDFENGGLTAELAEQVRSFLL